MSATKGENQIPLSPQTKLNPAPVRDSEQSPPKRDSNATNGDHHLFTKKVKQMTKQKFIPAQIHTGKCWYVSYYVNQPGTDKMVRIRKKVNHITDIKERKRYALKIRDDINTMLYAGWNPFLEKISRNASFTISAAMEYYLEQYMPPREDSSRSYRSVVHMFREWLKKKRHSEKCCEEITDIIMLQYMHEESNRKQWAPRTYNNNLAVLKSMFAHLVNDKFCTSNPCATMHKKRVPKEKNRTSIPDDILRSIHDDIEKNDPKFMLVIKLIFYCGIRPKEISRLRVQNIRIDDGVIYLYGHQTKNHHDAPVTIPNSLLEDLRSHIGNFPPEYFLFRKERDLIPGKIQMESRDLNRNWCAMRKRIKLPMKYKLYSIKDTGILHMAHHLDPLELKNQVRHSSLHETEKYITRASPTAVPKVKEMPKLL